MNSVCLVYGYLCSSWEFLENFRLALCFQCTYAGVDDMRFNIKTISSWLIVRCMWELIRYFGRWNVHYSFHKWNETKELIQIVARMMLGHSRSEQVKNTVVICTFKCQFPESNSENMHADVWRWCTWRAIRVDKEGYVP